ncbi:MAG: 16S rRNA (guanine(527)-N(7))-methyltransferase RsmG [Rhodobacteraceae bacterium]|nr:16S rRNA (guanine(527)-N(7))-methyltransferase RsmG [Paracoccaceae bacterium]
MESVLGRSVSRETLERLKAYEAALLKWSQKINLVARATYSEVWTRHILDSAQLYPLSGAGFDHWCDLGSGGGLPGMVLACLGKELQPGASFTLIESDARKAAFLMTTARSLDLPAKVVKQRIETAKPADADVVSARALAPLRILLGYCRTHLSADGIAVLPKGRNVAHEVEEARQSWQFDVQRSASRADPEGAILTIRNLRPKDEIR